MTTAEQQKEIEEAFKEKKYIGYCQAHGWYTNENGQAREDHDECLLSPEPHYSDDDIVNYNPRRWVSSFLKDIERKETER